jgi:hypothetical protein
VGVLSCSSVNAGGGVTVRAEEAQE